MPARTIPMNPMSVTGFLAGKPGEPGVPFESTLERDLYTILVFDLNVERVIAQPIELRGEDVAGNPITYFPDTLVVYRKDLIPALWMKPMLVEVKYRKDLKADWSRLKPKFKLARAYARKKGYIFKILTEVEIRTPFLKNAQFLLPYRKNSVEYGFKGEILSMLSQLREATPDQLLAALRKSTMGRAELLPELWRLVVTRQIGVDLTLPLTMDSRIWRQGTDEEWSRWAIRNPALFAPASGIDFSTTAPEEERR